MNLLLFLAGLALLTAGGEAMVRGAVRLARCLGLSTLLIGIVIIGFGTSMPEMLASTMAVLGDANAPGIALGNVIGSNIANILLVLGLTAALSPIAIPARPPRRDFIFLVASTALLGAALYLGRLGRPLALLFTLLMALYILLGIRGEKKGEREDEEERPGHPLLSALLTAAGIAVMVLGAKLMVTSAVKIAAAWGVSDSVIGLTIVAVGTSLPELAASLISALHKETDMAVGNIIGSNIFNALFILGVTGLLKPFPLPAEQWQDYLLMAIVTGLFLALIAWRRIPRCAGLLFLLGYVCYIACLMR